MNNKANMLRLLIVAAFLCRMSEATADDQKYFDSPTAAVQSLVAALRGNDTPALIAIFGAEYGAYSKTIGDAEEVKNRGMVAGMADQLARIESRADNESVVLFGYELWPFPAPMVKDAAGWRFDTKTGLEEIRRRRIGENEMHAIAVCREYLNAQREYAGVDRDDDGVLEYAQRILSSPNKRDGLSWEVGDGEPLSPFGPLLAKAEASGAKVREGYMGYRYKVLTAQADSAPGGRYAYIDGGNMADGFALVAWPVEYGDSGVMTFIVNHIGAVYEKDLGEDTANLASRMDDFDPDVSWALVVE